MSSAERRRSPRLPARLPVDVVSGRSREPLFTAEIGLRGVFIVTDTPRNQRQLLSLTLTLPDSSKFKVQGMVARVVTCEKAGELNVPAGMGVQFYGLSRTVSERWEVFFEELRQKGWSASLESSPAKGETSDATYVPPPPPPRASPHVKSLTRSTSASPVHSEPASNASPRTRDIALKHPDREMGARGPARTPPEPPRTEELDEGATAALIAELSQAAPAAEVEDRTLGEQQETPNPFAAVTPPTTHELDRGHFIEPEPPVTRELETPPEVWTAQKRPPEQRFPDEDIETHQFTPSSTRQGRNAGEERREQQPMGQIPPDVEARSGPQQANMPTPPLDLNPFGSARTDVAPNVLPTSSVNRPRPVDPYGMTALRPIDDQLRNSTVDLHGSAGNAPPSSWSAPAAQSPASQTPDLGQGLAPDDPHGAVVYRLALPTVEALEEFSRSALATGGVFLRSPDIRAPGTSAVVSIVHPLSGDEFHLPGEIIAAGSNRPGVAVHFHGVTERTLEEYKYFIALGIPDEVAPRQEGRLHYFFSDAEQELTAVPSSEDGENATSPNIARENTLDIDIDDLALLSDEWGPDEISEADLPDLFPDDS